MKMFHSFALAPLLLGLPGAAQIPITSSIAYDANDPTNAIVLSWEAVPGKHYNVLTTTALSQQPAESVSNLDDSVLRVTSQSDDAANQQKGNRT